MINKSQTDLEEIKVINWDDKIENNVRDIGEKSKGYKIMHIQSFRKISMKYKLLMYAGMSLGPLAGLLSAIGAIVYPPQDEHIEYAISATCTAFISGIIITIIKNGKFEEKSSHHKLAASKYTSLESNVRRQLVLCRKDRKNASTYLEYVGISFDELFLASPLVTRKIYNDYVVIAKNNGLIIPDEYGLTINVDAEYQKEKYNDMRNVTTIDVNKNDIKLSEIIIDSPNPKRNSNSDSFKGTTEIKRTETFVHFPELNKFCDGKMEYEMQRMMGLK